MTVKNSKYEDQVKRRVLILQKYIREGKIQFAYNPDLEKSLLACRFDANGEIDLSTVDSTVRTLAFAAEQMEYREQCKNLISLKEIQEVYFRFFSV